MNLIKCCRSFLILPKTAAPDAPRVVFSRLGMIDPNKYHITEIMSMFGILQKVSKMFYLTFEIVKTLKKTSNVKII